MTTGPVQNKMEEYKEQIESNLNLQKEYVASFFKRLSKEITLPKSIEEKMQALLG